MVAENDLMYSGDLEKLILDGLCLPTGFFLMAERLELFVAIWKGEETGEGIG